MEKLPVQQSSSDTPDVSSEALLRERRSTLQASIFQQLTSMRELADGYRFVFQETTHLLESIFEFILLERQCNPFFNLALNLAPHQQGIELNITGGENVKDMLRQELGLAV